MLKGLREVAGERMSWLLGARSARTARGEIVYAIGDIHGRLDLFLGVMRRIENDWQRRRRPESRLRIVVLGDFIDRGPDTRRLINLFMSLQRSARLTVLLGNHEALLLDSVLGNASAQDLWMGSGGDKTMSSFGEPGRREDEDAFAFGDRIVTSISVEVIEWLRALPTSFRSGEYFFCHAGVRPGVPLDDQLREDLLWIRTPFMASQARHGAVVVHGHNVVEDVEFRPNRISLDTAAYRTHRLSVVCLDGTECEVLGV